INGNAVNDLGIYIKSTAVSAEGSIEAEAYPDGPRGKAQGLQVCTDDVQVGVDLGGYGIDDQVILHFRIEVVVLVVSINRTSAVFHLSPDLEIGDGIAVKGETGNARFQTGIEGIEI